MQCCNGGEPRGPRRVGCQRIISQARDVPPRFPHSRRRSQSVWPLRTTVGVIRNLRFCLPDPPLTARDGAKHECTNNKIESLQQTFTRAYWHFKRVITVTQSIMQTVTYPQTFTARFLRTMTSQQIYNLLTPYTVIAVMCDSKSLIIFTWHAHNRFLKW